MKSSTGQSRRVRVTSGKVTGQTGVFEVEHPDYAGWRFELSMDTGVLVGLAVRTAGEPLGKRKLQALPMSELEGAVRKLTSGTSEVHMSRSVAEQLQRIGEAQEGGRSGRSWPPSELAALCRDYLALVGSDRAPVPALAGARNLSVKRIRNLLAEAREQGLMTRSAAGRAGGLLTDKAKEILDGQH